MTQTLFDYSHDTQPPEHDWQDDLARVMDKQRMADIVTMRAKGIWPPPWLNEDIVLQQDEARLLSAIADNCGLYWHGMATKAGLATIETIGMPTLGHAKTVIMRCYELGYIAIIFDNDAMCRRIDMTELGRDMLDMWETDQEGNQNDQ